MRHNYQGVPPLLSQQLQDDPENLLNIASSRYTSITQPESLFSQQTSPEPFQSEENYHSVRTYAASKLQVYNMKLGSLPYSSENQKTLSTIVELINQRQRDQTLKEKFKEDIHAVKFQNSQNISLLKQSRQRVQEKDKLLGRVENQNQELKQSIKKMELRIKKEREEDKKVITMIKSKNEQILHEVKKKQNQIVRIKEQMKKNSTAVGSKNTSLNSQSTCKNTFEIIQRIQESKSNSKSLENDKLQFLEAKYEKELRFLSQQNQALKAKFYEVREILVNFAEWIDKNLFGVVKSNFKDSFIVNHYAMFSKDFLTKDLRAVISDAKKGVTELQENLMEAQKSLRQHRVEQQGSMKAATTKSISPQQQNRHNNKSGTTIHSEKQIRMFKKKSQKQVQGDVSSNREVTGSLVQQQRALKGKQHERWCINPVKTKTKLTGNFNQEIQIPSIEELPSQIQPSPINRNNSIVSEVLSSDFKFSASDEQPDYQMEVSSSSRRDTLIYDENEFTIDARNMGFDDEDYEGSKVLGSVLTTKEEQQEPSYGTAKKDDKYGKWDILFSKDHQ